MLQSAFGLGSQSVRLLPSGFPLAVVLVRVSTSPLDRASESDSARASVSMLAPASQSVRASESLLVGAFQLAAEFRLVLASPYSSPCRSGSVRVSTSVWAVPLSQLVLAMTLRTESV